MNGRRKKAGESSGQGVGLMMTVSLFLIILTFFVLLCSIAVRDEEKTRVAIGSLVGSFGSLPRGLSPLKTGKTVMPLSAPMVEESSGIERIISQIDAHILGKLTIEARRDSEIITVEEELLFDQDSHRLKPSGIGFLRDMGRFLSNGDYLVEIIGHTDNTAAHVKGYRSNWELSALSAVTVLKSLAEDSGIDPARLMAFGAGAERPIVPNATRESRQKNRRVEIVLHDEAAKSIKRRYREEPAGLIIFERFDFKVF